MNAIWQKSSNQLILLSSFAILRLVIVAVGYGWALCDKNQTLSLKRNIENTECIGANKKYIFDIILFILICFQVSTYFALEDGSIRFQSSFLLVGANVLLLIAMVPYAKWVWKINSNKKALSKVAIHEIVILGIIIGAIMLVLLKLKGITTI